MYVLWGQGGTRGPHWLKMPPSLRFRPPSWLGLQPLHTFARRRSRQAASRWPCSKQREAKAGERHLLSRGTAVPTKERRNQASHCCGEAQPKQAAGPRPRKLGTALVPCSKPWRGCAWRGLSVAPPPSPRGREVGGARTHSL